MSGIYEIIYFFFMRSSPVFLYLCFSVDALYASVQPAGEAAAPEMVHGYSWAWQEKDGQRAHAGGAGQKTQNVQLLGMERSKDSLQEVEHHAHI